MTLSFDGLPEIDHRADEIGLTMHFTIRIVDSNVDVTVDVNKWDIAYFDWVYVRAFDFCRTCIDIFHFATGNGFTLLLDRLVTPDGQVNPIMSQNPGLSQFCTFVKFPAVTLEERKAFEKALVTILSEPPLFFALRDLMESSLVAHQGITNCARVIDRLRKIVTPGLEPKQGWPIFRGIVNVDEAYLQTLFNHAKLTRHGDNSYISGAIVNEIVHKTHRIVNRFIEYRLRGNQPLPLADFPMLIG